MAIKFEFNQELLYKNLFNVKGKSIFIPRSFVYKEIFIKYGKLIDFFFWPLIIFWSVIIHPIYTTYLFLILLPKVIITKKRKLNENIYIELSDIKYFTFISKNENNYPSQRLICPFYKTANRFKAEIETITLEEVTSISIFFIVYLKCIFFSIQLIFTNHKKYSLYSYTSFNYFLLYDLLKRNMIENIWLTNHYDRWVVLANCLNNNKTNLVQHGQLDYFNINDNQRYRSTFPFKLTNINTIYTQNEESIELYKDFVDSTNCEFKSVKSKAEFIEWRQLENNTTKILFIGHTNDSLFHRKLIKKLHSTYKNKIDIAYKYHPLQIAKILDDELWHITSGIIIPIPDVVISYGSSIDVEFKSISDVVVYNYAYEDNTEVDKVFEEIINLNLFNELNV